MGGRSVVVLDSSQLTYAGVSKAYNYEYDAVGNLTLKSDYSTSMVYDSAGRSQSNGWAGPNAVRSITRSNNSVVSFEYDKSGNMVKGDGLTSATYNVWNKPTSIVRDGVSLSFLYGPNKMRHKQTKTGPTSSTLYYYDSLYEIEEVGGETVWRAYIGDVAIVSQNEQLGYHIRFTHKDRLGSSTTLTDHNGNVIESREFDAFGKPRSVDNLDKPAWEIKLNNPQLGVRGFTDHEHLDDVRLIHMNGRVYDYNLGRFMSVDPFVHEGSQGINPYSYIMNNPLAGTDPTGYSPEEVEKKVKVSVAGSRIKRTVTVSAKANGSGGATISISGGNGAARGAVKGMLTNKLEGAGFNVADIGSQKSISQQNEGGTKPPNAEKRSQMPELLNDFVAGRISFPQGMDNDIARSTMQEVNDQAADYFGLEDPLDSNAGWVARTAIGEFNGMRQPYVEAMAWVIRNRVESKHFPNSYKDVVLQRKQFSSWNTNDPNYDRVMNPDTSSEWFKQTLSTARRVLNAPSSKNPLPNVRHYYSPRSMTGGKTPSWAVGKSTVKYKDVKSNYMTLVKG